MFSCSGPDCNYAGMAPGEGGLVTCPMCFLESCLKCSHPSHPGLLCEEVVEDEKNAQEHSVMVEGGYLQCPRCRVSFFVFCQYITFAYLFLLSVSGIH